MRRRAVSLLVGVVGFVCAGLSLVFFVVSSLFADAHAPNIDLFVRTPFPTATSVIVFDVETYGGTRTGIEQVVVRSRGEKLAVAHGEGPQRDDAIIGRAPDTEAVQVRFPVRLATRTEPTLALDIDIDYVVAITDDGLTANEGRSKTVHLDLDIYSSSGRHAAQLARVLFALGCFLVWFLIIWGVVRRSSEPAATIAIPRARDNLEGLGLLMGFLGGSLLGYWLFTWRIATALELHALGWSLLLTVVWSFAPLAFVWRWNIRRKKRSRLPSARVVAR